MTAVFELMCKRALHSLVRQMRCDSHLVCRSEDFGEIAKLSWVGGTLQKYIFLPGATLAFLLKAELHKLQPAAAC